MSDERVEAIRKRVNKQQIMEGPQHTRLHVDTMTLLGIVDEQAKLLEAAYRTIATMTPGKAESS